MGEPFGPEIKARDAGIAGTMAKKRNIEIGIEGRSGASDSGVTVRYTVSPGEQESKC